MNDRLIMAIVLAVGLLAGCGGASGSSDILLTRPLEYRGDELAGIAAGVLELDLDRGCILLSGRPVVWPAQTTLMSDPPELALPGGLTARSGDTVRGGGGEIPGDAIRGTPIQIDGDLDAALECAPTGTGLVVFWANGEVTVTPGG